MSFRALLVTKDDQAAEVLTPVLSNFGLSTQRCGYSDAVCVVTEQKFQALLVDFDDPHSAALVLQNFTNTSFQTSAVTVALLSDKTKVRSAFGAGANFVLYKPVDESQAVSTFRAATALIKRERRASFRVPIQVAVMLSLESNGASEVEGILLDISETGMDVLASQPLYPSARLSARFTLPNSASDIETQGEVAWANPNGETGVRFRETPEPLRAALQTWIGENSKERPAETSDAVPDCKLTDLSLGGCYIETASPFPERTRVTLILRADKVEFKADGTVRVMHPARGMGVEFAAHTSEQRKQREDFISFLTSRPGVQPELLVAPQELGSADEKNYQGSDDVDDALLDLLRNHEAFSEEMFLQALQSQRTAEMVSE